ncbi:MAG: hypothetical protein ABR875_02665 [Minisyncoccia bacterium]|jgi:hypothetical protein
MLNQNKTGLALGVFGVIVHFLWTIVVLIGLGKWGLDLVFRMHYLANPFVIKGVTILRFVGLMIMAFVAWYIVGWLFAAVWNWVNKKN